MGRDWLHTLGLGLLGSVLGLWAVVMVAHVTGVDLYAVTGPVGDWLQGRDGPAVGASQQEVVYGALGAAFGLAGLYTVLGRGLPAFVRAFGLRENDPVPVEDLHLEDGAVAVAGVAEPVEGEGTVASTYTGTECLAFESEGREYSQRDGDWRVTGRTERARPFSVTDDTGTVPVDPTGATFSFARSVVLDTGRRKQIEWRLEPGETAYVSGRKLDGVGDSGAPGGAATYLGAGEDPGSFTISDASERRTVRRFLAKGILTTAVGLLFLAVGAGMLYALVVV